MLYLHPIENKKGKTFQDKTEVILFILFYTIHKKGNLIEA